MTFEITPRSEAVGGGWRMQVFDQDGVEIAGGVFPAGDAGYCDACDEAETTIAAHEGCL